MLYVIGDATEEDILEKAGLNRAAGLIAALPLDKDNLVVTVIVRQRFPGMRIVTRSAEPKFLKRMSARRSRMPQFCSVKSVACPWLAN